MTAEPIRLKGLTISGYRGISNAPGEQLRLEGFGDRNLFIGQNNGGKSTVFSWLLFIVEGMGATGKALSTELQPRDLNPTWFWQQNPEGPIRAELVFSSPGEEFARSLDVPAGAAIVRDGEWRLEATAVPAPAPNQWIVRITPLVWLESKKAWQPTGRVSPFDSRRFEPLDENGEYLSARPGGLGPPGSRTGVPPFQKAAAALADPLWDWAAAAKFFDPFRSLRRTGAIGGGGRQRVEDGTAVLMRLHEWAMDQTRSVSFQRFRTRLIRRLNKLFEPPFASLEMKEKPLPDMVLTLEGDAATPIPLLAMGSGIAEMVIILASLEADVENTKISYHYYLEEPELHLHPRLLRRFLAQLGDYKNVQFFISSHSNIALDSLSSDRDRVFLFTQTAQGNCVAQPVREIVEKHAILDALGVSGSTLLQTNCVIWVEGPSDRLYLRKWLDEIAAERKYSLLEGADYCFVFYGGKVLSHFGFESDTALEDIIEMMTVSRFSAVVMDRDKPRGTPDTALSETKRDILKEAERDSRHRLACVTDGREIENDLPAELFKEAAAQLLRRETSALNALTLAGNSRYPDEIVDFLKVPEGEQDSAKRKLADKVTLARKVVELAAAKGTGLKSRPSYAEQLYEFVVRARVV
jgi:hypothetical protein